MEAYQHWPNLAAMMFGLARGWPERPMLRAFRHGKWQGMSWSRFARLAASCARRLRAAGLDAGDRVMIVSEGRPEYPIAETALMAIRAIPVPTYTTNTVADHAHILRDSGARAAITSSTALAGRIAEAAQESGDLEFLVVMDEMPAGAPNRPRLLHWSELVADTAPPDDIAQETGDISAGSLACLIYTSGTGGAPRGVMLSHRAILANCRGAFELMRPLNLKDEVYLSVLPLSHAYEHTAGQFFLLSVGTEVVYGRGLEHLAADLLTVRPTIMIVVPRLLEAFRTRILLQLNREPSWRRRLFELAHRVGTRRIDGEVALADRLLDPLVNRFVRPPVLQHFGGRFRAAMSGGARLEADVGRFFLALGCTIMQGYGQTEAGPVISANPPDRVRIDTVGRPLDGVELRIADDGEILVRGDLVMEGYWGAPDATAAVIRDGWLHTGDIGTLDADGYLRITDRKRDIIVLAGGENVSPARIEGMLVAEPEIVQAVVAGDGDRALAAVVVPAEGCEPAAAAEAISRVNRRLSVTERIRRHIVVPPFTVENGFVTPTQKIRRSSVLAAYANQLATA